MAAVSTCYDDRETELSRALCVEVGLVLGEHPPSRVLDVGCGTGGASQGSVSTYPMPSWSALTPARPRYGPPAAFWVPAEEFMSTLLPPKTWRPRRTTASAVST